MNLYILMLGQASISPFLNIIISSLPNAASSISIYLSKSISGYTCLYGDKSNFKICSPFPELSFLRVTFIALEKPLSSGKKETFESEGTTQTKSLSSYFSEVQLKSSKENAIIKYLIFLLL